MNYNQSITIMWYQILLCWFILDNSKIEAVLVNMVLKIYLNINLMNFYLCMHNQYRN